MKDPVKVIKANGPEAAQVLVKSLVDVFLHLDGTGRVVMALAFWVAGKEMNKKHPGKQAVKQKEGERDGGKKNGKEKRHTKRLDLSQMRSRHP